MELEHEFTVPVPVEAAWSLLLDVERVAPCMPGATLDSIEGEEFIGRLKVRLGAMTITYRGNARIVSADEAERAVTLEGSGKEARGSGTASATIDARLHEEGDVTRVTVHTKLNVTGRPAQFGRNILSEVGAKLIDRFAKALSAELQAGQAGQAGHAGQAGPTAGSETKSQAGTRSGAKSGTKTRAKAENKPAEAPEPGRQAEEIKAAPAVDAIVPAPRVEAVEPGPAVTAIESAAQTNAEPPPDKPAETRAGETPDPAGVAETTATDIVDQQGAAEAAAASPETAASETPETPETPETDRPAAANIVDQQGAAEAAAAESPATDRPVAPVTPIGRAHKDVGDGDAIDLLEVAGPAVAKRAAPVAAALVALFAIRHVVRRRRGRHHRR